MTATMTLSTGKQAFSELMDKDTPIDVVLSSGFLAFARHLGFLDAIVDNRIPVDGICGTSSGALVGGLFAAGHSTDTIAGVVTENRPIASVGLHGRLWRGLFTMTPLITRLTGLLPATFEQLERPLAVGVRGPTGAHRLLTQGPLPEAIAASCAVPYLFAAVPIQGERHSDGGAVDRLGLSPWSKLRGERPTVVHEVERTLGHAGAAEPSSTRWVVRTPRSGANLFQLGPFEEQRLEAQQITANQLRDTGLLTPR